jgi:2,4-dienoyl-CoA reductase-like NADH-dependent reductase (Old Yellow Enzyme family)/thioredoxin reductase
MKTFPNLFSPIRIGPIEVKNRIVMAPMGTNMASHEGEVSRQMVRYYEARAKGGVGLMITEDTTIGPNYMWNTLSLAEDRFIPGWLELTKTIHSYGTNVGPQIFHPAFNAPSSLNAGSQPVSASRIPSRVLREIPRELTEEEIEKIVEQFGEVARRAREGGCDFVQIHCAHMHHLLAAFLSPYSNKRCDQYGVSLEGRLRLPIAVIRKVRSQMGSAMALIVRISGDEYLPGGRTLQESQFIAPLLAEAGADAIHVSAGTSLNSWITIPPTGSPQAPNSYLAESIKRVATVPVICVGRITEPWAAEGIIATGKADMVALGRALLADPDWPNKVAGGLEDDIAPCMGETLCMRKVSGREVIKCLMNPCVGREGEEDLGSAPIRKRVLVVGGGPAGLVAARVAAKRGHSVTLLDKATSLGGQLLLAAFPPMKQEYTGAVRHLVTQAAKAGVHVELGREVSPDLIERHSPDALVLATGGQPVTPAGIPGSDNKNVFQAWDVLAGRAFPGPRVVIIGGGKVGCETADYLAHPVDDTNPIGNRVTILEIRDHMVLDDLTACRSVLIQRLKAKGVSMITSATVLEILPERVRYRKGDSEETTVSMDAVVLALGTRSSDPLSGSLRNPPKEIFVIGDAKSPGNAMEAIEQGWDIGRMI